MKKQKKYSVVGLGGTFDHFHAGHAWFLEQAALFSETLIIGVTTEALLKDKAFADSIESCDDRANSVKAFLTARSIPHEIVPLSDVAGPALSDERIQAVVLTEDTLRGGEAINRLRTEHQLAALPIEVVPLQKTAADELMSSHSIRAGTHNRAGASYGAVLKDLIVLNDKQRQSMRVVQGEIVATIPDTDRHRCIVGDTTLRHFLANNISYTMAIIDGKERRETYYPLVIEKDSIELTLVNPAGSITPMLVEGLSLALRKKMKHIFVDGEEDLAAVALQLLLPLGSTIYYGQPDEGIVRWLVTEDSKEKTALLLNPHFQTNPKLVE